MIQEDFSHERFKHAVLLDASIDKCYEMVATAKGLESWFLGDVNFFENDQAISKGEIVRAGQKYKWIWKTKDYSTDGLVIDVGNYSVIYTFSDSFEVAISCERESNRTKITLTQTNKTGELSFAFINCCVCWVFFLTNLKSVLENNIDLREVDVVDECLINQ